MKKKKRKFEKIDENKNKVMKKTENNIQKDK